MRIRTELLLSGVLVSALTLTACHSFARLSKAEPPLRPASPSPATPILQEVVIRANVGNINAPYFSFVPDFHFVAPNGNAAVLHRELVATSGRYDKTLLDNEVINIPAAAQREGAMISGGWRCGSARYSVTSRAYVIDTDGNHSNAIDYTFHCNGG
jgi:hypothetical protein